MGESSERLEALGVTGLVYGTVTLVRHGAQRASITARTVKADGAPESVIEAFRERHCTLAESDVGQIIPHTAVSLNSSLRLSVTYQPADDGLAPKKYRLSVNAPFVSEADIEPWIGALLALCDGKRTAGEIHQQLQSGGAISTDFSMEQFVGILKILIGYGYLSVDVPGLRF